MTKQILISFLLVMQMSCQFPLRKTETLATDQKFIFLFLKKNEIPSTQKELHNAIVQLQNNINPEIQNDLGILYIYQYRIDLAEQTFLKNLTGNNPVPSFLNLSRMLYLLEEYELLRKHSIDFIKKDPSHAKFIADILLQLEKENRQEEKVILLGVLYKVPGFELSSMEYLGKWYYFKKNYAEAEYWQEQILAINPFHKSALYYMSRIQNEKELWTDTLLYAKTLLKVGVAQDQEDIYYIAAHSYYKLNQFEKALSLLQSAPEEKKYSTDFLDLWQNTLLSLHPEANTDVLKPYWNRLKERNLAIDEPFFLITQSKDGKKLFKNIILGK